MYYNSKHTHVNLLERSITPGRGHDPLSASIMKIRRRETFLFQGGVWSVTYHGIWFSDITVSGPVASHRSRDVADYEDLESTEALKFRCFAETGTARRVERGRRSAEHNKCGRKKGKEKKRRESFSRIHLSSLFICKCRHVLVYTLTRVITRQKRKGK